MRAGYQATIGAPITMTGVGVHSGRDVHLHLHPARANHGVVFLRTGLPQGRDRLIEARYAAVTATELCTVLGEQASGAVATVEHLMSALAGLGIDNVLVEVDGAELPILDGSASPFVKAIDRVGIVRSEVERRYLKVLKPVKVERGVARAELLPNARGLRLEVEIDFQNAVIGRQRKAVDVTPESYRREIASARTFGFIGDVEKLWKAGFALGASLENTVAIGEGRVINPEGLRFADEFVRHKMLDAVGDLALAGLSLQATYRSYCSGHRLNIAVLEALFSDRANYAIVGGVARRGAGYAEIGNGIAVPVFAPDLR